ncbi:hypothetical protein KM043_007135 [Ampulex compressa]|nr:hypothetical protein KM043_007135 [Ampulex compressa]
MKAQSLIILQIIFMCCLYCGGKSYCFQYTWVGPKKVDCKELKGKAPCFSPIFDEARMPDPAELWLNVSYRDDTRQELTPDQVCVKYTYLYNNKITNVSYFRGKITEDETKAVESGCYTHHVDGHIIEACACRSRDEEMPCNTSVKINYNAVIIAISLAAPLLILRTLQQQVVFFEK